MRVVTEVEFAEAIRAVLSSEEAKDVGVAIGPGRSGAVAAVYASHILGVPFIPYSSRVPTDLGRLLIIDTARESGATLRKAARKYEDYNPLVIAVFEEPPRVSFWYEATKPQRYKHERIAA